MFYISYSYFHLINVSYATPFLLFRIPFLLIGRETRTYAIGNSVPAKTNKFDEMLQFQKLHQPDLSMSEARDG